MNFVELLRAVIPTPAELKQNTTNWVLENSKFWGASFGVHAVILLILGVAIGAPAAGKMLEEVIFIDSEVDVADEQAAIEHFEVGETPVEPTVLNTESLTEPPATIEQDAQYNDASAEFVEAGGGMSSGTSAVGGLGVSLAALGDGPALTGAAGLEVGKGDGSKGGSGGAGEGFGGRGSGSREKMLASGGGTADTERAVGGAVNWLARHQNTDGSWGCGIKEGFARHCKDPSCTKFIKDPKDPKEAIAEYHMAATAFGLLPYFAAGQTHETGGPYKATINRALTWMTRNQNQKTGQLGTGSMYEHGLATIAICEAYGLSKDRRLQPHAQAAIAFIEEAQNDKTGGWHYVANPTTAGDTSVVGWQLMALKSGEMAGLRVNPQTLVKAKAYLKTVAKGKAGGLFSYMAESGPTPTMSAVGLLCNQYGGMKRTDPAMVEGQAYVMSALPQAEGNPYFFYYATQVMHNLPGPEWDTWNRNARRFLIKSQIKEGCAAGSWSSEGKPHVMGPVMMTSICALTLEVYYRYLPLYQIEGKDKMTKTE